MPIVITTITSTSLETDLPPFPYTPLFLSLLTRWRVPLFPFFGAGTVVSHDKHCKPDCGTNRWTVWRSAGHFRHWSPEWVSRAPLLAGSAQRM